MLLKGVEECAGVRGGIGRVERERVCAAGEDGVEVEIDGGGDGKREKADKKAGEEPAEGHGGGHLGREGGRE